MADVSDFPRSRIAVKILYHHRTQGEEPESIHIESVVSALRKLGHEVRVIGPVEIGHRARTSVAGRPHLLVRIKRLVPRAVFELLQVAYNLIAWWHLVLAVRQFAPEMIYERYALFNFAGVMFARRRGIPLILEVNTPYAHAWAKYFGLSLRRLGRWIERKTLLAADQVVTVTHVQRSMLQEMGIPAARISVSHNAVDPDWFCFANHFDPELGKRLGLNGLVVGFVGTMNRWQGIPQFQDVIRSVVSDCPDVSFLFVGDGEFKSELEDFCRNNGFLGRVVFAGRQQHSDIPKHIAAMDIGVLLNSNAYGSPMKIFEYWAMGKAVIAPSVPAVMEVLRPEETGLLIDPGNARQMAEKIVLLAQDAQLRLRLGRAGRDYVVAHHTWRRNAEEILRVYGRIENARPERG